MPDDGLEKVKRSLGHTARGKGDARRLHRFERPLPRADQEALAEDKAQIARLRQTAAEAALVIDNRAVYEICGMINELMIDRLRQGLAHIVGERGELFQETVDANVLKVEMQPDEALARRAELLDVVRFARRRRPSSSKRNTKRRRVCPRPALA